MSITCIPRAPVRKLTLISALLIAIFGASCGPNHNDSAWPRATRTLATVARTSYGIPHVRADNFRGLGFGLAYAYAQDNVCMFADSLLTVRGERAQFFGPAAMATASVNGEYGTASDYMKLNNEDSDFFYKGYLDLDQLKAGYAAGGAEARDMLAGYVDGYNRYLSDHVGKMPAACNGARWVRTISVDDMYLVLAEKALHASGQVFAREIVDGARDAGTTRAAARAVSVTDRGFIAQRLARLTESQLGSNALALGRDTSASGRGILLGNPHYPWTSTDRFYQAHLTVPGRYDVMGVVLGGIPAIVIGFNQDMAWTHTVTTAVHFTTFRLTLDPHDATGTTYLADGVPTKMRARTVSVDSLQPDGTMTRRSKTFYFSEQGAVMVKADAGMAWSASEVHVLGDPNRNNTRLMEQWIGIGSAHNVKELKTALDKTVGLPWVNTIAADRDGNALFADASVVPRVTGDRFASDCLVNSAMLMFDGSRSACAWGRDANAPTGIFSPANAPWTIRGDYVGNSNDSYWLSNARALLSGPQPYGYSPLYGKVGVEQKLRTRVGFKQIEEALAAKPKLDSADVQRLVFADRVHAAELILPAFLGYCGKSADALVVQACNVLAAWDRHADVDSRGAVLFREFWSQAVTTADKWAVPLDPRDPVNTPRGLSPAAAPAMLAALGNTARKMQGLGLALDARLGDLQGEVRNGVRTALHGSTGDIDGSYNSLHMQSGLTAQGYGNVAWGTSYVQTVTFDDNGPVAQAMLLYGQSVDPKSAHYGDQIGMYGQKRWPTLPFSASAIKADPAYALTTLSE